MAGNSGCSDYLHKRVVDGIPYIGAGLGAQSFSHNTLAYNLGAVTKKLSQYLKSIELNRIPIQDLYYLSKTVAVGKFVSVSFYFGGIDLNIYQDIFNETLESRFAEEIHFLLRNGLMIYTTDPNNKHARLQMTKEGKKCFPGVIALFYTPLIQQHLMDLGLNDTQIKQRIENAEFNKHIKEATKIDNQFNIYFAFFGSKKQKNNRKKKNVWACVHAYIPCIFWRYFVFSDVCLTE